MRYQRYVPTTGSGIAEETVRSARAAMKSGDVVEAFRLADRLIIQSMRLLHGRISRRTRNEYDFEEVCEAAYLIALAAVVDSQPRHEFWEYNFAVCILRTVSDEIRRVRNYRYPIMSDSVETFEICSPVRFESICEARDCLSRLPERNAAAIQMFSVDRESQEYVAVELRCTDRTVRNLIRNGRKMMAGEL